MADTDRKLSNGNGRIDFATEPSRYRHWKLSVEMEVATRYRAADGRIVAQEIMPNLRLHNDTNTSFVETAVGLQSSLVDALTLPGAGYSDSNLTLFPTSPGAEWVDLTGGDDALADLTVDDFVGIDGGSAIAPASRRSRTSKRSVSWRRPACGRRR
jgi:hypothetical protein